MATLLAPPPLTEAERTQTRSEIEQILKETVLDLASTPPAAGKRAPGRPPVLSALCLGGGLLVCVLHGFSSYLDLWRLLTGLGLWRLPPVAVTDGALYARLDRDGTGPLERLFAHFSTVLAARLAPWTGTALAPFAAGVYALDETTLDQVARLLPSLRGPAAGAPALLPGKLTGLFDLRRQQWARVEYQADARQNEKVAARGMLTGLAAGSLLLADLGYFGFQWFDDLTAGGYWWVSRLRAKTSYTVCHPLYQYGDTLEAIVWLGAHRAAKAKYAVRLVQFRHHGTLFRYVTNVLDPTVLAMAEVARLYARRWDIELAFNLIKTQLKLHLLWGAKPVVVLQQVWAVLIIAQVLQALRVEIAGKAGVDVDDVSLPLLVRYLPYLAQRGLDPVATIVERGAAMRIIRPASRTVIVAPAVPPEAITPVPPDLAVERTPRYAARTGGPRRRSAA
jgi:hypothetical protein